MPVVRTSLTLLLPVFAGALMWAIGPDSGGTRAAPAARLVSSDAPALRPLAAPPAPATPAPAVAPRPRFTHRAILDAIRLVETGGQTHPRDGDGGQALGPYQIWRPYWRDAVAAEPALKWIDDAGGRRAARHEDCRRTSYAEAVVRAFMRRHAPEAWQACDAEVIARVHNGGPAGARRAASRPYWNRVEAVLRSARGS